jgi:hypothetical protein
VISTRSPSFHGSGSTGFRTPFSYTASTVIAMIASVSGPHYSTAPTPRSRAADEPTSSGKQRTCNIGNLLFVSWPSIGHSGILDDREGLTMKKAESIAAIERLLLVRGWAANEAAKAARESVENGELEDMCFGALAEHVLATIHSSKWIVGRAKDESIDGHEVIRRLLKAGASPDDLALFARVMQREFLSNLGCILDGAGILGTPDLPLNDFRVFAVDDDDEPIAKVDDLHEQLGWTDLDTEMRLSREAEEQQRRAYDAS